MWQILQDNTSEGTLIAIAPYLSDYCEWLVGFKRIVPSVFSPDEYDVDYLLVSHEHRNHFDVNLLRQIRRENLKIFGPAVCKIITLEKEKNPCNFIPLEEDRETEIGNFTLLPVKADHSKQSPKALGLPSEMAIEMYSLLMGNAFSRVTTWTATWLTVIIQMMQVFYGWPKQSVILLERHCRNAVSGK